MLFLYFIFSFLYEKSKCLGLVFAIMVLCFCAIAEQNGYVDFD